MLALQKIKLSSAKKRWEIFGPLRHAATLLKSPNSIDFLIRADSPSTQKRNKKRESGSPGRKPLEGLMCPRGLPLIFIEYVTVLTHLIISFTQDTWKPILHIIFSKHPHSTLSKALLMNPLEPNVPKRPKPIERGRDFLMTMHQTLKWQKYP